MTEEFDEDVSTSDLLGEIKAMRLFQIQGFMSNFIVKKDSKLLDLEHKTVRAEFLFTRFVVEHNLPIAVADHVKKLMPVMFPDSEIAKKFHCSGTKTTALIKMQSGNVIDSTASVIGDKPFNICTNGSNDQSDKWEIYPVIIRHLNKDGIITSSLLHVSDRDFS